ncbi:MAG TPA: tetratricopeptide repeat protein [Syntrophobacteraceae bacterium]|nr:tetratricopeptide repeat protein [Syntrophobacteraceae bacterium]
MLRADRFVILMALAAILAGCSRSPEARKARYTSSGDRYFSEGKYTEAVIQCKNVLQIEGNNVHAVEQLGYAHYALGEMEQACRFLSRARDLDPDTLQVRSKLGNFLLLAKKLEDA